MADRIPNNLVEFLKQLKKDNIPQTEYSKRINRFLSSKAWKDSSPFSGQFELTPLCNLNCKMCYVHLNGNQIKKEELLSKEQWIELMEQAFKAGMRKATLTGGECLTFPGFDDIYLFLYSSGVKVTVLTNGILLDSERIEFFKAHPPAEVRVTLYGSSNEVYEQVTGYAQFDTVWNNLQMVKSAGLPLSISITPNRFMEKDAEQLVEKTYSLGIPFYINSGLLEPREETGRKDDSIEASLDTYVRMYQKRKALDGIVSVPVELDTLPEENKSGETKTGIVCGAGMNSFQISWNGDMFPCTNLRLFSTRPLQEGFTVSWEKLNSEVKKLALPVECHGCPYEEMCGPCIVQHIQNGRTDKCNKERCQRTKYLVSKGILEFEKDC